MRIVQHLLWAADAKTHEPDICDHGGGQGARQPYCQSSGQANDGESDNSGDPDRLRRVLHELPSGLSGKEIRTVTCFR